MYNGNNTLSGMGDGRTYSETATDKNDRSETPNEGLCKRNRKATCRDQIEMDLENDVFDVPIDDVQETLQSKTKPKRRRIRSKRSTQNPPTEK